MSQQTEGPPRGVSHTKHTSRSARLSLAVLLGFAVCLFAAPSALAKFSVKKLHLGTTSGAEDYLFTAGNTVVEQASVDRARYYRFDVYDPSGTVHLSSACRPSPANGQVSASYTLQSSDPLSNTTAWRFRLREFGSSSTCTSAGSAQHDGSLYFDVAAATSSNSAALATTQTVFGSTATAYVQVAGVGEVKSSGSNSALGVGTWSTSWILPSGATACANTTNNANDLPGSTAGGQLPDQTSLSSPAMPSLQYRPSLVTGVDPWNLESNYETRPCQNFASTNQGRWSLLLSANSTHFVKLPAFSVNTTPPDTTITSGPSNVTASQSATFDFISSEPGSTFLCSLDGAAASTCSSGQMYNGLADGPHTFSVQAVDPAGNVDPTPATASWTVETKAPTVTLTAPAAGIYTNDTTPAIIGTAEVAPGDSGVTVTIYAGAGTGGNVVESLTTPVQGDGSWTINATALPEGTYTAQAQQTDAVNNTGYSQAQTFTVDTTPPAIALYAPANGTHTNDSSPEISGVGGTAVGDLPTVTVTITGGASPVLATATVSSSGTWDVDLAQTLPDGNYTIQASQQDLAGNTGYSTSHVTIDTSPPQTFLDAAPVGVTSSTTATFAFHSTDALSQAGSTFQCQLDGGAWGACKSPQSYFNLANGTHTFSVEAIDGAGNVDTIGQTVTWTINTLLPAITLDSPGTGSFTNDSSPTFSGTAGTAPGDSSSVQVLIYSGTDLSGSPVQTLNTTAASDDSWSVTAATLPDGTYAAYAQQSGSAGTGTSDVHTFTVVTQPPTTTITLGPPGNSGTGTAGFSFTSSAPGATFQCQLDGGGWTPCTSPQDYSGLGTGSHTFQVRSVDRAGNVGAPASETWSVNTSLPALSLTSPADGADSNNPTLAISGTGGIASGDASTVTVNIYSGTTTAGSPLETLTTTVGSGTGSWVTHPSPGLQDGTYTVYAQQAGSAGTAYTAAATFTIDTTPPTTSITSGPQGTTSATSARFAFTSSEPGGAFQCQLDAGAWTSCTSPQSYSALALGTHTFSVRATDPAGNVDPNPPVVTWTIDTPANVPVTLTTPADGTMTNDTSPTFSGTAGATDGDITVEIDDANGDPVEFLDATQGSSWSVTASPALPDGTYSAFASQLGPDGVTTDYSSVNDFTVDTTPPAVTLTSGPAGTGNDNTPSFGGGAGTASGDQGSVTLDIYSGTSASGTPVQTISGTLSGASWSATAAVLPDGTYSARAQQSDAAGNTGYATTRTFTIDTTPPAVTLTSGPTGTSNDNTPTFGGGAGTASGDQGSVTLDIYTGTSPSGTPVQTIPATLSGASWSATAALLPDGTYSARAQQSDAAGNTGYTTTRTFTIDTATPHTSITSAPPTSTTATSAAFSFTSSKAGSTFQCQLDGAAWAACTSPATYTGLAVGQHTFEVRATDAYGNVDPSPATFSWTVVAPAPTGSTPPTSTPPTSTPPTGTPPAGTTPPSTGPAPVATLQLRLTAKGKQRLSRRGQLKLQARCAKACSLVLSGSLAIAVKSRHGARTKPRTIPRILVVKLAANRAVTLTIKLSVKARRAVAAALAKKLRVTLTLSGVATTTGLKPGVAHLTVRLVL